MQVEPQGNSSRVSDNKDFIVWSFDVGKPAPIPI